MDDLNAQVRAVDALGALAHETRLSVFRMLMKAGPEGISAGTITVCGNAAGESGPVFPGSPLTAHRGLPMQPAANRASMPPSRQRGGGWKCG